MSMFFTADLHLGHDAIRTLAPRPFDSVEEMDQTIIDRWNDTVGADDEVFILGDYALGDRQKALSRLTEMAGAKYLIVGNQPYSTGRRNSVLLD